jgi:hypothetical protein
MASIENEDQFVELRRALHRAEDEREIERERRLLAERDLAACQVRCADALDAFASLKASAALRIDGKIRSGLEKLRIKKP